MADVTVNLTSAGNPTTWGQSTFNDPNLAWGGNTKLQTNIGSNLKAYTINGWGAYSWGSPNPWGLDYTNINVNATTPITPTTWGFNKWGESAWNGIAGTQTDLGSPTISYPRDVSLTGVLLNLSTNTVIETGTDVTNLNGNLIQSTLNSVNAVPGVEVYVTTPGSNTAWGYSNFGSYAWASIVGDAVQIGTNTITLSSNISVNGNLINSTTNFVTDTGTDVTNLNGNLIQSTLNSVSTQADANINVNTPLENTIWGFYNFGQGGWAAIAGNLVEIGNTSINVIYPVNVNSNLIQSTINSVSIIGTANVTTNTNLIQITLGNENTSADANKSVTTNLIQSTINTVNITASDNTTLNTNVINSTINNVSVQIKVDVFLTTNLITSNVRSVSTTADANKSVTTNLITSAVRSVSITASDNTNLITNLITSSVRSISVTADANVRPTTNLLQTSLGNETITADDNTLLTTNLIQSTINNVSITADANVRPITNLVTSYVGNTRIIAWAVVDINTTNNWNVLQTNTSNGWTVVQTNTTNTWTVVDIAA